MSFCFFKLGGTGGWLTVTRLDNYILGKEVPERKEVPNMRNIPYLLAGVLILSLFLVHDSFSDEMFVRDEIAVRWDTFKATDLFGASLETPVHEYIGRIDDLVINPSTERMDSVLVKDVRGLGAKVIAIPFSDISRGGYTFFVYNPPEDRTTFYGEMPYWVYDLDRLPSMDEGSYRLGTLQGASVESREGDHIAYVNDFIINRDGHIAYVVLSHVEGMEDNRMIAVPLGMISKKEEHLFTLHTSKEMLFAAPVFRWPDAADRKYAANVQRYFGLRPYWEME
jgi:sporulation protein YlmC with PRC-barrel domain